MGMYTALYALDSATESDVRTKPAGIQAVVLENSIEAPGGSLDLDKNWHGLHFLLTGTAWDGEYPLSFICTGGEELGGDLGYGPARLVNAEDVVLLKVELDKRSGEDIRKAFSKSAFKAAEIYPDIWDYDDETEDELAQEFAEAFGLLREFVDRAATAGHSILVALT